MKVLECSSKGDRRFSSFYARLNGKSIEEIFQSRKIGEDGKPVGKGKVPAYVLIAGEHHPLPMLSELFYALWYTYLTRHPELVEVLREYDGFTDMFDKSKRVWLKSEDHSQLKKGPINSQAEVIAAFLSGRPLHPLFEKKE